MKRVTRLGVCALALFLGLEVHASSQALATIADLASALDTQRNACVQSAADAKSAYSAAEYKSHLDHGTAALRAEMDARVYGVSNGRRQTADYYARRMDEVNAERKGRDKAALDTYKDSSEKVIRCIAELKEQGKKTYVEFKQRVTSKAVRSQAESLMAAWIANVNEISTGTPNGEDASFTAWKNARAMAEVSAL